MPKSLRLCGYKRTDAILLRPPAYLWYNLSRVSVVSRLCNMYGILVVIHNQVHRVNNRRTEVQPVWLISSCWFWPKGERAVLTPRRWKHQFREWDVEGDRCRGVDEGEIDCET